MGNKSQSAFEVCARGTQPALLEGAQQEADKCCELKVEWVKKFKQLLELGETSHWKGTDGRREPLIG